MTRSWTVRTDSGNPPLDERQKLVASIAGRIYAERVSLNQDVLDAAARRNLIDASVDDAIDICQRVAALRTRYNV